MTTIIVIVVVALVFFVTVCVVTFMVWKREAEMRTDSIRSIEENLEKLEHRLSSDDSLRMNEIRERCYEETESQSRRIRQRRESDPFAWIRAESHDVYDIPEKTPDEDEYVTEETPVEKNPSEPAGLSDDFREISTMTDTENPQEPEATADWSSGTEASGTENIEKVHESGQPCEDIEEPEYAEINLDFDSSDFESSDPEDNYFTEQDYRFEQAYNNNKPFSHDVGRSGKKYTAQELETLIKE